MAEKIGDVIGQYQLERLIGQGGMGAVYQAIDVHLERPVALKMMRPEAMSREEFRRRFLQEARAIAKLDHPNIIKIYSFQAEPERHYLAMEYVAGGSLRDYLDNLQNQGKRVPIFEALTLCRHVAAALDYAHTRGMIHRDVKPDNVLLKLTTSSGDTEVGFNAILTDFGLAKLKADPLVQTQENMAMGTLPYMSPEQLKGQPVDGRTDIYAVGVMLYELIVGKRPYSPKKLYDALDMHDNNPPIPPSQIRNDVTAELESLISRTMAKHPEDRYQSGHKLVKAIQELEDQYENIKHQSGVHVLTPEPHEERIITYLSSIPNIEADSATGEREAAPPSPPRYDEIVVQGVNFEQRHPLTHFPVSIGRDDTNDIPLPSKKVSRNHARIDRRADGQYTLVDLNSTNGCYIDNRRLNPNVPSPWHANEIIRIGDFEMMLDVSSGYGEPAHQDHYDPPFVDNAPTVPKPGPSQNHQPHQRNSLIRLHPERLNVHPGMKGDLMVEVTNDRDYDELFQIRVRNLPDDWRFTPASINLPAHATDYQTVKFSLPNQLSMPAGTYEFIVEILGHKAGAVVAAQTGIIVVPPIYGFAIYLNAQNINNTGEVIVSVLNQGNSTDSYSVTVREREEGNLAIEPPTVTMRLNPGQEMHVPFMVRASKRRFMRGSKPYAVDFYVTASNGESKVESTFITL